ncbi:MAG: DNA primase [bacterium]
MQPSEEIKSRLDIVEVIREYMQLKQAGSNFKANCPFHREKTPSFMVSQEKQIWHCFGCGKGGDIFSFVMESEGVDFSEALRILAPKAGVVLIREDPQVASQKNKILDILELSRKYFNRFLREAQEAVSARAYLKKRGLSDETIEEWQVGCSPDAWEKVYNALRQKGYTDQEIFLSGMSVKKNVGSGYYDRFRGRIMFPINNINGDTVAFSARISPEKENDEKQGGKYINSPQTQVYDKSKILFALDKAKQYIKKENLAIIVEGQMDAITAHQNGFKNVVASSGTALTEEQIKLIKRYTNNIALSFDMDEAGKMAADRGIKEAMRAEMNIRVIELPDGKDPDECIKNNPKMFADAVDGAKEMMQYYFDKTFLKINLKDVSGKREAAKILLPIIVKLGNAIERDYWLKELGNKIDVDENLLREAIKKSAPQKKYNRTESNMNEAHVEIRSASKEEQLSELLLSLTIKFPFLIEYLIKNFDISYVIGKINQVIYKNLLLYYNNIISASSSTDANFDYNELGDLIKNDLHQIEENKNINKLNVLDRLVLLGDKEFPELQESQAKAEIIKISVPLKENYLKRKMLEIEKKIAESEKNKDKLTIGELMEEFKKITERLKEIKGI